MPGAWRTAELTKKPPGTKPRRPEVREERTSMVRVALALSEGNRRSDAASPRWGRSAPFQ